MTATSWYFESSESIYFDIIYADSRLQRFKIIIKPDLSDASLHVINSIPIIISNDLMESFMRYWTHQGYRICEDYLVCIWDDHDDTTWGAYAGLTSAPSTKVIAQMDGCVESLCPTSGRFVYRDNDEKLFRMVVGDLF